MDNIKTWQERMGGAWAEMGSSAPAVNRTEQAMQAEIADLRAALARAGTAAPTGQQDARIAALRAALLEISETRFGYDGDCGTTRIADDALYADEQAAATPEQSDTTKGQA